MIKLPRLPNLSEMSARERLLAASVVFSISVVLLDRVVLGPWMRHVNQVRSDIGRLESSLRTYQRLLERKDQITAEVESYSSYLEAGSKPTDTAGLLREIEGMGKESGLSVGEVKPLVPEPGATAAFEVHTTGTFKQWVHFVYLVQNSNSFFWVDRSTLSLAPGAGELLNGALRISCKPPVSSEGN